MTIQKCPGMSSHYFKPEDIKEKNCIHCGKMIEFWKDDVKVPCPSCGKINFNPDIGNTCLVWCKSAAQCIGNDDIDVWLEQQKKNNVS